MFYDNESDESDASRWLDGCDPDNRRPERRAGLGDNAVAATPVGRGAVLKNVTGFSCRFDILRDADTKLCRIV